MRSGPRTIGAAAALALLLTAGTCGGGGGGEARPTSEPGDLCKPEGIISVGESIPACTFEKIGGGTLRLADLAGKPSLINFWASWCTFCIDEMPALQKVYASFGGRVTFVGANMLGVQGETAAAAEQFGRSTGVRYPLIYDTGGQLYANFSARLLMPVTIFVRSDGIVAHRLFGPISEDGLRELLSSKLGLQ